MGAAESSDGIERIAPAKQYPVLYVDDEPENLLVFRAVFGDEFTVLTAQSAEEALQVLAREPVSVLVADQRMPHTSGIELCHLVWERLPTVRRMLLTAYSDHQTAIEAINRGGVHAYLEKPWDPTIVRRALWEAVNRVHLDRTVSQLRDELAEREFRLEQARTRERLLHDVANATTRLTLSTRALRTVLERNGPELPAAVREELAHEADALARTTDHLVRLQHERTSAAPLELKPVPLRVDELLRTVVVLAAFSPADRVRLRIECPPGLLVHADRLSVTRILVNVLLNARQAFEREGLSGEVLMRVQRDGGRIAIDITDNGPGIPEALRERVFEEYFTTRREAGGTGLGLATARELARANGGSLELPQPQPEKGAHFRLTLPAPVRAADREARPPPV